MFYIIAPVFSHMPTKSQLSLYLLFVSLLAGFICIFVFNFSLWGEDQFIYLAKSFLEGKLYFTTSAGKINDTSFYHGHYFWPQGPFPAVLLLPFVAVLGLSMHQGYLQFFLTLFNFFLLYKISFRITGNVATALWISFGFIFGSVYFAVALIPWSSYFAHIITTALLFSSLLEFLGRRRWLLIGVLLGLSAATRISTLFSISFFMLSVITGRTALPVKIRQLTLLLIPVVLSLVFLSSYNFFRFGNPFEFGYRYHNPAAVITRASLHTFGVWNIIYYPANLYYLFLKSPDPVFLNNSRVLIPPFIKPDIWGMSILLTSPWLLILIKAPWKKRVVRYAFISSLLTLLFILGYFGGGGRQYGYRYALDFYPFLCLIAAYAFQDKIRVWVRAGIIYSFLFALYVIPLVFQQPLNP